MNVTSFFLLGPVMVKLKILESKILKRKITDPFPLFYIILGTLCDCKTILKNGNRNVIISI